MDPSKKRNKLLEAATPYLFLLPWMLGFLILTAGPLVFSLVMSFFDWSITGTPKFIGIRNFVSIFTEDPQFYKSLSITFKFAGIFVPLNLAIALFLAMLIAQKVEGVKIFRAIFYLPSVVSSVAVAIIWSWILNGQYGILNYLLSLIGVKGPLWLLDQNWAFVAIIIASAWGVGTMMLIFYTDIKTIPEDIYEAAALDGISPVRQFFQITVPIITPSILFNLITSIITALQQLTLVLLLTNGGPLRSTYFYGMFVYNNAFRFHKLGYAAASSWFMFIIILILTTLVFRSSSAWVYYESEVQAAKTKTAKGGKKR
jgi:multiple sugar transport system permease protein